MKKSACLERLWYYWAELQAKIRCHAAHDIPKINGQVPKTVVTGNTAYVSELVESVWYQWIYYRDATTSFPLPKKNLENTFGPPVMLDLRLAYGYSNRMVKLCPRQHCVLSLILNLLVIQKRQRETYLPRLSTKILVPPSMTLA